MSEPVVGATVDQYELTELLARSGMASIFKAIDRDTGAEVALKIPHAQLEGDVVFHERFQREEGIGQRLNHPNIVKVLTPRHKSRLYLTLEFVAGKSLRTILGERAPMPTLEVLGIARQICDALVHMHALGVVHRDLKPENVLITQAGSVKLLDFGIALDNAARRLTWAGLSSRMGTPDYMAPEQIRGRRGDVRTDIYSLGVMLFEMLTGELPHGAANVHALLRAKAEEEPKSPCYFVPGIDASVEAIVLRALERMPRDRHPSAAALLLDLQNPGAVAPRDPATGARASSRALLPSRLVVPLVIGLAISVLAALIWQTSPREPPNSGASARTAVE